MVPAQPSTDMTLVYTESDGLYSMNWCIRLYGCEIIASRGHPVIQHRQRGLSITVAGGPSPSKLFEEILNDKSLASHIHPRVPLTSSLFCPLHKIRDVPFRNTNAWQPNGFLGRDICTPNSSAMLLWHRL